MTAEERNLAVALRDYCYAGHRLPVWHWSFVKQMSERAAGYYDAGPITDKQGDYLRKMAGWYGV
jgi:hypothetical protein